MAASVRLDGRRPMRLKSTAMSICVMSPPRLKAGDVVLVNVEDADEHDLFGVVA